MRLGVWFAGRTRRRSRIGEEGEAVWMYVCVCCRSICFVQKE